MRLRLTIVPVNSWEGTAPVILFSSHGQNIASEETNKENKHRGADSGACGIAHALWPLHHLRLQGTRSAGRSGGVGSRQLKRKNCSPGARPFAEIGRASCRERV